MNNTTTYNRSMFGLTEINADTINANNLVLSGPLQVNTITSTAAGQSLGIDALGTGSLDLKSNSVTNLSIKNNLNEFYFNTYMMSGRTLFLNAGNNLQRVGLLCSGGNCYFDVSANLNYFFRTNGVIRFTIGQTAITSTIYITAPTEAAGSNNTRLATTAFVQSLKSTPNVWTSTNEYSAYLPTSLLTPTLATEFTNKNYVDNQISAITTAVTGISYTAISDTTLVDNNLTIGTGKLLNIDGYPNVASYLDYILYNIEHIINDGVYTSVYDDFHIADGYKLRVSSTFTDVAATLGTLTNQIYTGIYAANNTWTGTNTFDTHLPTSSLNPSSAQQLTTKSYVDLKVSGLLGSANIWTNTNTFNTNLPTSTATPTTGTQLTTKTYVDSKVSGLLSSANTWTNTNAFNAYLPTSTLSATSGNQMLTLQSFREQQFYRWNKYNSIVDDFLKGLTSTALEWTSTGSGGGNAITSIAKHPGIWQIGVGNVQNEGLVPTLATNVFFWGDVKIVEFVWRFTGDATCFFEFGMTKAYADQTESVSINYNTTGGNGFKFLVNASSVYTTSFNNASSTSWLYGRIVATTAGNADFYIENLTIPASDSYSYTAAGITTTNPLVPYMKITNQNANVKYLDMDYFSMAWETSRN